MAQGSYNLGGEEVKQESSWRYLMMLLLATLILSSLVLYYFIGPDVDEFQGNKPRPTISDDMVEIRIDDVVLSVPANYTELPRDRRSGEREQLFLYAAWPRMEGYTRARHTDFTENRPDSRRIDITIGVKRNPFSELQRLEIQYTPHLVDAEGTPYEHDLTKYVFKSGTAENPASGYSDKELYTGIATTGEKAVLFCYPEDPDRVLPPECFREFELTSGVYVKYRFKRPYLSEWRKIDQGVKRLVGGLQGG